MCPTASPQQQLQGRDREGLFSCPKEDRTRKTSLSDLFLLLLWLVSVSCHPHAHAATARSVRAHSHSTASPPLRSDPAPVSPGEQDRADSAMMASNPQSAPSPPSRRTASRTSGDTAGPGCGLACLSLSARSPAGALGAPRLSDPELPPGLGPQARTRHTFTRLHVMEARGSLAAARGPCPLVPGGGGEKNEGGTGPGPGRAGPRDEPRRTEARPPVQGSHAAQRRSKTRRG